MLKKFNKILSEVLNTFENIMENGAFAPYNIFKYMIFQMHQKGLLWSKGLRCYWMLFMPFTNSFFTLTLCMQSNL